MRDLNISLIQPELAWQDPAANRKHFEDLLDGVATDLVILPEMFSTGFTMDARANSESMNGDSVLWMADMAKRLDAAICGSLIIEEDGRFFNRLIWMQPNAIPRHYDKRHLFRMAEEQHHYSAGNERLIVEFKGWRIAPLVCYDLRFPVWSRGINEFELLLYVANWPASRRSAWQVLLPARAVENLCYVAGVNRVGTDGAGKNYAGDSVACDYLGHTLADLGDREEVATVTLDASALLRYRDKFPAHLDADAFDLY